MTFIAILLAIAVLVVILLWATRDLGESTRCPACGVDRADRPHRPRCYWRDR